MKPREMYSGAAPAAMGMMGQGIAEAGANIARSIQQGYQGMGEGLSKGINAAADAYSQYKSAKTSNDITRVMLDDPQYREMLGIRNDEDAKAIKDNLKSMIDRHGQIGGAEFSRQFLGPIQQYYQMGREYELKKNVAIALSNPEAALKAAQTREADARAKALGAKQGTGPLPEYTGGNYLDQPVTSSAGKPSGGTTQGDLPEGPSAYDTGLLIPKTGIDNFPSTQKSTLPIVGNRNFTPEEMAIYIGMSDKERAAWHRKNDPVSNQKWSPNATYKPATQY